MWNFCDDNGIHPASYVRLRAEIFPGDDCAIDNIKHWMGELISAGLVREYAIENKTFWIVTGWKRHQRIDRPTYKYPLPLSEMRVITDSSSNNQRILVDNSQTAPQEIIDSSNTDRNGKEGNGKEKDIREVETSQVCVPHSLANTNAVFIYWQHVMKQPHAKLDKKRSKKIEEALNLGYTTDDLKLAIDGCSKTPFNTGLNDRGQRYDSIDLIFRDADHIDQFISNSTNPPCPSTNNNSANNPMAGAL